MPQDVTLTVTSRGGVPAIIDFELDHYIANLPHEFRELLEIRCEDAGIDLYELPERSLATRISIQALMGYMCILRGIPAKDREVVESF